jgi:hypothetical protein
VHYYEKLGFALVEGYPGSCADGRPIRPGDAWMSAPLAVARRAIGARIGPVDRTGPQ